jgi:hypothetical protein
MGQPTDDHTNTSTRRVDNEIAHSCVTTSDRILRKLNGSGENDHADHLIEVA